MALDEIDPTLLDQLRGFESASGAYTGPRFIQIDVANPCNLACVVCWTYSPRVEPADAAFLRRRLSLEDFQAIVDDLEAMGTRRISLAGVGDPVTHPRIDEMVEYAKKKDIFIGVTTNGTLFPDRRLRRWVDAGVDWIHVSVLGSTPAAWAAMHPKDDPSLFHRMKNALVALRRMKNERGTDLPGVSLTHIICQESRDDVESAVGMGADVGANSVEFYGMDSFPEIASLALTRADLPPLRAALVRAKTRARALSIETNIDTLLATLRDTPAAEGVSPSMPRIPCYHGWIFARITADGSVYPCCGAVGRTEPIGNVHGASFREIWFSAAYDRFRRSSRFLWRKAQDDFRERYGCLKCPDLDVNIDYHRELRELRGRRKRLPVLSSRGS